MNLLFSILILSVPAAPEDDGLTEAFHCDFESAADQNFDGWPDQWQRRIGPGYPQYLKIEIVRDKGDVRPTGQGCLRIGLNGGAATLYSPSKPPTRISSDFSYVLEAYIKAEGLKHNDAYISLMFLDADGKKLTTHESAKNARSDRWTKITLGPLNPKFSNAKTAVIGLHTKPRGKRSDLHGSVMFDDIRLTRLPRMSLTADHPHGLYTDANEIQVKCEVSGIHEHDPLICFDVLDVNGTLVAQSEHRLAENAETDSDTKPDLPTQADLAAQSGLATESDSENGFAGTVTWHPPLESNGLYRVRATMKGQEKVLMSREIAIAVVQEQSLSGAGEFGWSLPQGGRPLPLRQLADLLRHVGVDWVKYPVWSADKDANWTDRIAEFVERLGAEKIQTIGVLDEPPADQRSIFGSGAELPVASVFVEPELWQPVLDPVMTRLSMKVHWWQLGRDDDTSFVDFPDLKTRIKEIKDHLEKFGQKINLGIGWQWLHEPPDVDNPPWSFLALTEDPAFTQRELATQLKNSKLAGTRRWLTLEPLARSKYSRDDRIRDLVMRMLAAKIHGADSMFLPAPFDPEHGVMNPDGTPGELLLPWRTTAMAISGKAYLGQIAMPGGSKNHIFASKDGAVMFVWNHREVEETIFLGHRVEQFDLWGRKQKPRRDGHRSVIRVGRSPTIITGINRPIAEWRISFEFDKHPLRSVFGQSQVTRFRFKNTFDQGVGGALELQMPKDWQARKAFPIKLPNRGGMENSLAVVLNNVARTGEQPIRVDFDITADRNYSFSVYRTIQVGRGDVVIKVQTRLDEEGTLVVSQTLMNQTDQFVSFDCLLFAPSHRRQRIQVINLARGRNTQTYFFPDGQQLVGKTLWLRAEEIGGQRVLNYHVEVER